MLLSKIRKVGQSEKPKFWGVGLNFYIKRAVPAIQENKLYAIAKLMHCSFSWYENCNDIMIRTDVMARKPIENYEKWKKTLISKGFRAIVTYFCNETMFSCLVCVNARNTYIMMQV